MPLTTKGEGGRGRVGAGLSEEDGEDGDEGEVCVCVSEEEELEEGALVASVVPSRLSMAGGGESAQSR